MIESGRGRYSVILAMTLCNGSAVKLHHRMCGWTIYPVNLTYSGLGFCNSYLLYQLKSSQLTPSSWYSLRVLPLLYSLDSSNFFHELADGRDWAKRKANIGRQQRTVWTFWLAPVGVQIDNWNITIPDKFISFILSVHVPCSPVMMECTNLCLLLIILDKHSECAIRNKLKSKPENFHLTHHSFQARLSVLDFLELFDLAFIYVLLQFPCSIFIGQRAPLHQVVDNRLRRRMRAKILPL